MSINNLNKVKLEDCAFIIIDMQEDFIVEGAPIECKDGRKIIPNIQEMIKFCHNENIPVMYTKEIHRPSKVDFGMELERNEPEHCIEGSKGVQIVKELTPTDKDYIIYKRRYSSFYLTDLEILLKGLKKNTLIISGAATNVCVYATALDAQQRDMHVIVLEDCVAGTEKALHEMFLKNIDYVLGDVTTSKNLTSILKK